MNEDPTYLGDGAYIKTGRFEGELIIYTTDGITESNVIYLDEYVTKRLLEVLSAQG